MARIFRVAVATFCVMAVALSSAQDGVIEFVDTAPPPTDQDKARAKEVSDRAVLLEARIQTFATLLNATLLLKGAIAKITVAAASKQPSAYLEASVEDLKRLLDKSVFEDQSTGSSVWKMDLSSLQALVGKTIQVAQLITQQGSAGGEAAAAANSQADRLSLVFDAMIAEHAVLNRALRYYPLSVLASQSPVSCQTVNSYSRDFKCLPQVEASAPDSSTWRMLPKPYTVADYCQAEGLQNFHVADWAAGYVTLVRKESFSDHVLPGQLENSLSRDSHTRPVIGGTC